MDRDEAPYSKQKRVVLVGEDPLTHFPGEASQLTWWAYVLDFPARKEVQCECIFQLQLQGMFPTPLNPQTPMLFLHSTLAMPANKTELHVCSNH